MRCKKCNAPVPDGYKFCSRACADKWLEEFK